MKAITLLVVVALLGSCFYLTETVRPTVEAVETQIKVPSSTQTATFTPVPSFTATNTLAPSKTPTITLASTPTLIPTPEGLTEIGSFLWGLSNDLGFKLKPVSVEGMKDKPSSLAFWPYSENGGDAMYTDVLFSEGYEVSADTKVFLLISYGIYIRKNGGLKELGFSLFRGDIFPECQGTTLYSDSGDVAECTWMVGGHAKTPFEFDGFQKADENGITWFLFRAYPLSEAQAELLAEKYLIDTYPKQHRLSATPVW